jgi:hypothetical protein
MCRRLRRATYMTPELQAEVETHWPKDGDIDKSSGVVDKYRLKAEAEFFSKLGAFSPITSN